jgi:hypothetical protein
LLRHLLTLNIGALNPLRRTRRRRLVLLVRFLILRLLILRRALLTRGCGTR